MKDPGRHIALFMPDLGGGGAERVMVTLANGFAARQYKVDMVLVRAEGPNLGRLSRDVRVVDLGSRGVIDSIPHLASYLHKQRPLALLSALDYANVAALLAARWASVGTRVVVASHQTLSVNSRFSRGLRVRILPFSLRCFYPWADQVVAVSEGAADDLAQVAGLPRERIKVIYNPVVGPDLLLAAKTEVEHPWFRPGQPPVILSVGRLTPLKGFSTLIRAFAVLVEERESRLMILGDGPERASLQRLAFELGVDGSISLPGFVSNPYSYMSKAAIFVLSSATEALPTTLIEAMACGTPVISTDCPNGPREILEGGKYGRLVPVGDIAALADALVDALTGNVAPPPKSSVTRFLVDTAIDAYKKVLLGD